MQAALGQESPADLVQWSEQAMQLQEVDGLFGGSAPSTTENSGMAMQDLLTSVYSGTNVNLVG
jgi:hypothetical protein